MTGGTETERLAMQSLIKVQCCRVWEVTPLHPVGSCGICGEIPSPQREGK